MALSKMTAGSVTYTAESFYILLKKTYINGPNKFFQQLFTKKKIH